MSRVDGVIAKTDSVMQGIDALAGGKDGGERFGIAQPEIHALPGQRMHHMRRIADQRDALGDERARDIQSERIGTARAGELDVAEMQTEALLELRVEFLVGQRDDTIRFGRFLGPHQR